MHYADVSAHGIVFDFAYRIAADINHTVFKRIKFWYQVAKRGFSAAARSHESVHFSVGNGEIYVVKHFFVVVVGKTNVLKHYIAFEVVHLVRRGAFKLDRNIHNRDKTSESRHAVLQLLEKLYERLHGRNEKVYRNHKRHEVYVVEMLLVVYAKQCA